MKIICLICLIGIIVGIINFCLDPSMAWFSGTCWAGCALFSNLE